MMRTLTFGAFLIIAAAQPACSCGGSPAADGGLIDAGDGDGDGGGCPLLGQGEVCSDHQQCCSGFCDGGECAATPGGCDEVGTACATGATCCSGTCADDGQGN